MDLSENQTYNIVLNLDAYFPGFLCNQDWVHDSRFCQSDKPTRLDSKYTLKEIEPEKKIVAERKTALWE